MKRKVLAVTIIMVTIVAGCGFVIKSIDESPYSMAATPGQKFTELSRFGTVNELETYLKEYFSLGQSTLMDVTAFMVDKGNPPCHRYANQPSSNDAEVSTFTGQLRCDTTAPKERFVSRDIFNKWMTENLTSWTYAMTFNFSTEKLVGISVSKGATGF